MLRRISVFTSFYSLLHQSIPEGRSGLPASPALRSAGAPSPVAESGSYPNVRTFSGRVPTGGFGRCAAPVRFTPPSFPRRLPDLPRSSIAQARPGAGSPLARIRHQFPAADADPLAVTGRTPSSRFNVVSTTPSASFGPFALSLRRLDALATKIGDGCGLAEICAGARFQRGGGESATGTVHSLCGIRFRDHEEGRRPASARSGFVPVHYAAMSGRGFRTGRIRARARRSAAR